MSPKKYLERKMHEYVKEKLLPATYSVARSLSLSPIDFVTLEQFEALVLEEMKPKEEAV